MYCILYIAWQHTLHSYVLCGYSDGQSGSHYMITTHHPHIWRHFIKTWARHCFCVETFFSKILTISACFKKSKEFHHVMKHCERVSKYPPTTKFWREKNARAAKKKKLN